MSLNRLMKQKFGFDVSGLSAYVDEQRDELLVKSIISSPTIDILKPYMQTGVKDSSRLKLVDVDVTYQDGTNCNITNSGDVTYTDRKMQVEPITVLIKLCAHDLNGTWAQIRNAAGSNAETQSIRDEQLLLNHFLAKHRYELEKLVWQGNTNGSVSGNLARANGFIRKFDSNSGSLVDLNTSNASSITSSNAYDQFYAAFEAMPENVLENGAVLWLGRNWYTALTKNLVDLNFFKEYTSDQLASETSFILPGTDLRVQRTPGLNSINKAFIARPQELIIGTDLESDMDEISTWYDQTDDAMYLRVKFKFGTQVPFLDQIGKYYLGAS